MNRYSRTAAVAGALVVGVLVAPGASAAARDGGLWGAATIAPGREGVVEVAGLPEGAQGVTLTLTAPRGTRVTGTPLDTSGHRGSVAADGRSAAYTVTGAVPGQDAVLPFVLAVPGNAVPGTRLRDCSLRLTDARGVPRAVGRCSVTVGLASPTLTRPVSGVPLAARPEVSGTAHPGAQVTVRDKDDQEACATTAAPDGTWSCAPNTALPAGANRLQAVAALNGVSAMSEQIDIVVAEAGAGRQ
ncbi:carboxypeptidase regulatory-like domain-containing protein [Streptomyces sp. SID7499]|uniref:Carboxypeptidase regulatory-like domain-containing protein n=1 Tax=Streptomyces sp. SID7499 TaxID=2706086 RepID=A0A6G3XJJ7_9ACTN|nr:carboxypeptidase regulatory-like domain-containing protein [Streptomyces sp. SID7499]